LIPDFNGVCSIIILTILADSFDCIFSWIVRFSFQFIFSFSSQMNFFVSSKIFQFPYTAPRLSLSDSTHTPPFSYLEDTRKTEVYRVTSFEGGKDLKKWTKFWKKKDKKTKIKARSSPTTPLPYSILTCFEKKIKEKILFFLRALKNCWCHLCTDDTNDYNIKKAKINPFVKKREISNSFGHRSKLFHFLKFTHTHTHTHAHKQRQTSHVSILNLKKNFFLHQQKSIADSSFTSNSSCRFWADWILIIKLVHVWIVLREAVLC
jgi:hypothetical protein